MLKHIIYIKSNNMYIQYCVPYRDGEKENILLTKTTAAQSEDALSYYKVRGLYFLAVVFVRSIDKTKRELESVSYREVSLVLCSQ